MPRPSYNQEYYLLHREQINTRAKAYYTANKEKVLARTREYYYKNHDKSIADRRNYHYKYHYGLTRAEAKSMLLRGCEICGGHATHVDHDHKSGKVRGALCNNCNTGLGMFGDSLERLHHAVDYLAKVKA